MIEIQHVGDQCPWTASIITMLKQDAQALHLPLTTTDMTNGKHELCFPWNIFYNGRYITSSRLQKGELAHLLRGIPSEAMAKKERKLRDHPVAVVKPLDGTTIADSCRLCLHHENTSDLKTRWYHAMKDRYCGYIGYVNDTPVVMLEGLSGEHAWNSHFEHNRTTFCIVCLYSHHAQFDYRASLLHHAYDTLKANGFIKIQIISGHKTHYPNGTVDFFRRRGYIIKKTIGRIYLHRKGYDVLCLMEREL